LPLSQIVRLAASPDRGPFRGTGILATHDLPRRSGPADTGRLVAVKIVTVRVKGPIGPAMSQVFEDLEVRTETVLSGSLIDDASLHGLLARVRDLGLEVVDVHVADKSPSRQPTHDDDTIDAARPGPH
jgi:hypothetical protein